MSSSIPADYWEPWQPQVGDRVRFRDSGECRCSECRCNPHPECLLEDIEGKVLDVGAGIYGAICAICGEILDNGHRILVRAASGSGVGMAAVIELELVERADDKSR